MFQVVRQRFVQRTYATVSLPVFERPPRLKFAKIFPPKLPDDFRHPAEKCTGDRRPMLSKSLKEQFLKYVEFFASLVSKNFRILFKSPSEGLIVVR